jgi:hypothetical protein
MIIGIMTLILIRIFSGSIMKWMFGFTFKFIFLFKILKFIVLFILLFGLMFRIIFLKNYKSLINYIYIFYYNNYIWFLSRLTNLIFNYKFLILGGLTVKLLDKGWIEYLIKFRIFRIFKLFINNFIYWQKNFIKIYLFLFILLIYFFIIFI